MVYCLRESSANQPKIWQKLPKSKCTYCLNTAHCIGSQWEQHWGDSHAMCVWGWAIIRDALVKWDENIQNLWVEGWENITKMQQVPPNSSRIKMEQQTNKLATKIWRISLETEKMIFKSRNFSIPGSGLRTNSEHQTIRSC